LKDHDPNWSVFESGELELIGGGDEVSRKAASVAQFMLLGIDRKSKTGNEPEDDGGDDELEQAQVLFFACHRIRDLKVPP
jgi:hypothetical protein